MTETRTYEEGFRLFVEKRRGDLRVRREIIAVERIALENLLHPGYEQARSKLGRWHEWAERLLEDSEDHSL